MKKRALIITGAGLTAGPDFFNITTGGITKKFLSYQDDELSSDPGLIKFLYDEYCFYNRLDPAAIDQNIVKINFETILQIVEELHAYIEDYERTQDNWKELNSIKGTVYSLNKRLIVYLDRVRTYKGKHPLRMFMERIYNHLVQVISNELNPYNKDGQNIGMREFEKFLIDAFPADPYTKRIYTLNYDNWLHRHAGYYDGFDQEYFNSSVVINDRDKDCQYNLHGCILWNWGRLMKSVEPEDRRGSQAFNGYEINREALLPSGIISGYNKLTRINARPFLEVFHSFTADCLAADIVLLIGYGFNDPHLNNNLSLIPTNIRIVVVIYCSVTDLTNQRSELHRITNELGETFRKSFGDLKFRKGSDYTIDSEDGRISIFINGIGPSFYKEFPEIIKGTLIST